MKAVINTIKEFKNISWPTWKETLVKTFVVIVFGLVLGLISTFIVSVFLPVFTAAK